MDINQTLPLIFIILDIFQAIYFYLKYSSELVRVVQYRFEEKSLKLFPLKLQIHSQTAMHGVHKTKQNFFVCLVFFHGYL